MAGGPHVTKLLLLECVISDEIADQLESTDDDSDSDSGGGQLMQRVGLVGSGQNELKR